MLTRPAAAARRRNPCFHTAGNARRRFGGVRRHAQIDAQAPGGRYAKLVVIHAKDKSNGAPVNGGKITMHAEMTCPMFMPLYTKNLQETSPGTYKAGYSLVMPGQWTSTSSSGQERRRDDVGVPRHGEDPGRLVATLVADRSLGRARCFPRRAWIADYA